MRRDRELLRVARHGVVQQEQRLAELGCQVPARGKANDARGETPYLAVSLHQAKVLLHEGAGAFERCGLGFAERNGIPTTARRQTAVAVLVVFSGVALQPSDDCAQHFRLRRPRPGRLDKHFGVSGGEQLALLLQVVDEVGPELQPTGGIVEDPNPHRDPVGRAKGRVGNPAQLRVRRLLGS
jgi:hypothetical protein